MSDLDIIERILRQRELPHSIRHVEKNGPIARAGDTILEIVPRTELVFNASGQLRGGAN